VPVRPPATSARWVRYWHHVRVAVRTVLGVDACPAGWVGVVLSRDGVSALVHSDIGALTHSAAAVAGPVHVVAIDIPIGLADDGARQADLLARKAAAQRWASVFVTPVRAALEADSYAAALAVSRARTGSGISTQAFRLRAKILQVDGWRERAPCLVVEAHPELSFAAMAGTPLAESKSTWAGAVRRRQLLAAHGIDVAGDLGLSGLRVGVDDVLDAAAVAWTATRVAAGIARRLPVEAERFTDGVDCAIWT
jgi:predicted RNase H-like nuclease